MTVFLNANSVSDLKFHPPGGSRAAAIAVPVKKENIEDFFPEAMKLLSYDYMSVEIFKYKFTKLIKGVLEDIESRVKSELAQYDRDEKIKAHLMEETKEVMAKGTDKGGWLHPNLRSKGIQFDGIPSQPKSYKEQKRLLASAIYYRNLKSLILMQIDQEYWFSLPAMKMFAERERGLEQLTDELNTDVELYRTKAAYSAATVVTSIPSFGVVGVFAGIGLSVVEKTHLDSIKEKSGSTTEPINCVRKVEPLESYVYQQMQRQIKNIPFSNVVSNVVATKSTKSIVESNNNYLSNYNGEGMFQQIPCVGIFTGSVNTVANYAAARSTKSTIESNKTLFQEMKYSHFKKLSKLICADFNELQENEIEALMKLLGINKNEYISL